MDDNEDLNENFEKSFKEYIARLSLGKALLNFLEAWIMDSFVSLFDFLVLLLKMPFYLVLPGQASHQWRWFKSHFDVSVMIKFMAVRELKLKIQFLKGTYT